MQPILSAAQMREVDRYTIEHEPIASIDLMERACEAVTNWIAGRWDSTKTFGVVCATGNNGGDGLGVARLLLGRGYPVKVWIVRGEMPESPDFSANLRRLSGKVQVLEIVRDSDQGLFVGCDVLVDAMFGTGLSRPLTGIYAQAVRCFNAAKAIKVAIDLPSGLLADGPPADVFVKADHTLTFQLPKLSFMLPAAQEAVGQWQVLNIGLNAQFIWSQQSSYGYWTRADAARIIQPRQKFGHKGTYGHALVIAGSHGKMGAAVLAVRGALRSGAGLVTGSVPGCGIGILQTSAPEAMVVTGGDVAWETAVDTGRFDAVGVGPGIGLGEPCVRALGTLLESWSKPVVLDADALNLLAAHRHLLSLVPEGSILTPHPGEFARLADPWKNDWERLERLRHFAQQLRSVVVLKGAHTAVAAPDGSVSFNSTGNPGMATGGSGDVLTGILTALMAQGYSAVDAARLGVWLHGHAGDLAAAQLGMEGMIASDIVEKIPYAFQALRS